MASLSRELRKQLENAVVAARRAAVAGAEKALTALRVGDAEAPADAQQQALRDELRAHGVQLGDKGEGPTGRQDTSRLVQACAYEHWHRMLFARYLAENDLLVNPEYGVPMSLAEIQETARVQNREWLELASGYAQEMLLEVFRRDSPVLRVALPPETMQELEHLLRALPIEVFTTDDSLGWVYQFWQRDEKERVNKSEVRITASELSPVTQLFTEDYMVLFLLHNTLGAWWTAKRRAEGKPTALPGYAWTYLRLNEDGSPAAGNFDGWGRTVHDLRILDPCMGSGHFLTFSLPIVAKMRAEDLGIPLKEAVVATVEENLYGLELDPRCSQIAAFNVALTAWKIIGEPVRFKTFNIACSGLGINAPKEDWIALAGSDSRLRLWMSELYRLFFNAPLLGSLVSPNHLGGGILRAELEDAWPLLTEAISQESAHNSNELSIAAKGLLTSARLLNGEYTLVITNVPYLVRAKQCDALQDFCLNYCSVGAADLATVFIERCGELCAPGGTHATVSPLNWLFIKSYAGFRKRLLTTQCLNFLAAVGSGATATASWDVLRALVISSLSRPTRELTVKGIETDADKDVFRAEDLRAKDVLSLTVGDILDAPNYRIALSSSAETTRLSRYADSLQGLSTCDNPRFQGFFWEYLDLADVWVPLQGAPEFTVHYSGREKVLRWEHGCGALVQQEGAAIRGLYALGKTGVVVSQMRHLPATLFGGTHFDTNVAVIVPKDPEHLRAIWSYCTSPEFATEVRRLDKKLNVTNATMGHVPFDLDKWRQIANERYPIELPTPTSSDPSQWIFDGVIKDSTSPLQVAVATLLGYRWPRLGKTSPDEVASVGQSDLSTSDGIKPLHSLAGNDAADIQLRPIVESYVGPAWQAGIAPERLSQASTVHDWLADMFFEDHCATFHNRPFIWHIWDGRKDGFHALVNYHKLAGPNGEGRKTLEKLIYTYLGDWIKRQRDGVETGADGAEGRLRAAEHLRSELIKILQGEPPYDIFVRWKPLHEQAIGWDPDLNDGVRLNMRPWLRAKPYCEPNQRLRQGACILRITPIKLPLGKDRGKEPPRDPKDFPWFADTQDRDNDIPLTLEEKRRARERRTRKVEHDA